MTSSQSVPAPLVRVVSHARMAGYFLAGTGAVGILASLVSSSLLGIVLAAVSAAGGLWLLWAIQQLGLPQEAAETAAEPGQDFRGDGVGSLLVQVVAHVCELAVVFGRAVLKVLASVVAGAGTGLVTMGVFALRQPELWEYGAVQRAGPPFAPVLLGAGVGLLTTEVLLIALFRRSWSGPAKAATAAGTASPREGESSSQGAPSDGNQGV